MVALAGVKRCHDMLGKRCRCMDISGIATNPGFIEACDNLGSELT